MSKAAYLEWYKADSHAIRSVCEQGVVAAEQAEQHFSDADAKALAADGQTMLARHQKVFVGILTDVGEQPNDFVDQIMKGIGVGVGLSLKAAEEPVIVDVALLTGEQTGLHFFIAAYDAHGPLPMRLDCRHMPSTSTRWSTSAKRSTVATPKSQAPASRLPQLPDRRAETFSS